MKNPYASTAEQVAALIRMGVPAAELVPCSLKKASAMFGAPEGTSHPFKHGARSIYAVTPGFRYRQIGCWKWGVLRVWTESLNAHREDCALELAAKGVAR